MSDQPTAQPRTGSPSPLVGEGARRADEGFVSDIANPSSGATRHLLPQGEKATADRSENDTPHHTVISRRTLGLARRLRRSTTPLEDRLWEQLRGRRFANFKFRRQVPIGSYVADFACLSRRLIIELDGGQHSGSAHDVVRDAELRQRGFRVLRIWNNEFALNETSVLETIWAHLEEQRS